MQEIKLTAETIEEIASHINSTEIESCHMDEEAEFEQGDNLIVVDYEVWATYHREIMVHTEVSWPNEEDLSYWELDVIDLNSIKAFDEDGEELTISDTDFEAVKKKIAA